MIANNFILLMEHALGRTPDARHDLMVTLNQAGAMFVECHPWSWRRRSFTLPVVASQNYVDLPEDFGELETATIPNTGSFTNLEIVGIEDIALLRRDSSGVSSGCFYASFDGWRGAKSGEDNPSPCAELYPTPSTDASPTMTVWHFRKWKRIRQKDTRVQPELPANAERALVQICRMLAVAIENNTEHELRDVRELPIVKQLIEQDGLRTGTVPMRMRGGAGRFREPFTDIAPGTISVS